MMKNANYTEQPWEVVSHPTNPQFKMLRGPSFTVSVVVRANDLTSQDIERRESDLRKMSAAPELLEALKRCRFDSLNMSIADMKFCASAIAKATGEK